MTKALFSDLALARAIRGSLVPSPAVDGPWQWGVIAAVTGGANPTVGVNLDGDTGTSTLRYLNSYVPAIGDVVLVARMSGRSRASRVVVGPLNSIAGAGRASVLAAGTLTGPYPQSFTFTNLLSTSQIVLAVSGTMFTSTAGQFCAIQLSIDGGAFANVCTLYFNTASVHATLSTGFDSRSLSVALHTYNFQVSGTGASSDAQDRIKFLVLELP